MKLNSELQAKIESLFKNIPNGVEIDWQISGDGLIEFSITQKPMSFSEEDGKRLISELNSAVLSSQQGEISNRFDPVVNLASTEEIAKRAVSIGDDTADFVNNIDKISPKRP